MKKLTIFIQGNPDKYTTRQLSSMQKHFDCKIIQMPMNMNYQDIIQFRPDVFVLGGKKSQIVFMENDPFYYSPPLNLAA